MIKLTNIIEGSTHEELEALQSLLEPFSPVFSYSILDAESSEFPFQLLVQIEVGATVEEALMREFLAFVATKINELSE